MAASNSQVVGMIEMQRPARAEALRPSRRATSTRRLHPLPGAADATISIVSADVDRLSSELDEELFDLMRRLAARRG